MSFLRKLFPKKAPSTPPPLPASTPTTDPAEDPNLIRVHDAFGRELFITREQWRENVLLGNIDQAWNDPDKLYELILTALNDGFRADVIKAARHLHEIDPNRERGACIWGIVLVQEERLDEAQTVFERYCAQHGESGVILTNLAKVFAARGESQRSEEVLWHALELDPNQDNGMGWYVVIHRERGGEEAGLDALRRVARLPGSWRAQLWLARATLQRRDVPAALALYREALSRVDPAPADALMQISGDLGNTGHLPELVEFTAPRFNAPLHGLQVGNNLIKAYLDLGQFDAARAILDQLYALKRPDWSEHLAYWDTELAKARVDTSAALKPEELRVAMLVMDGPVWLKPTSPAAELFPAKEADVPGIAFLGSSVEAQTNSQRVEQQLADTRGRLSRALPLFLAEQVEFGTTARAQTLVPWIANGAGGFVLSGAAWSDEQAAAAARRGETPNDYVVVIHLLAAEAPWTAHARLIRTIDGTCLGSTEARLSPDEPFEATRRLTEGIAELLQREVDLEMKQMPGAYGIPSGQDFGLYLLRLEQLLAVRCAGMSVSQGQESFLNGEREIVAGNIGQCLSYPGSTSIRVLMAQTAWTMKLARPEVLPEFRERIELLQSKHPLPEPAQSVVQRILTEAFET